MKKLTLVFRGIDAFFQSMFDAAIMFFMSRYGWKKSSIRLSLWGAMFTCVLVIIFCNLITGRYEIGFKSLAFDIIWAVLILLTQSLNYINDQKAEKGEADSLAEARSWPLLSFFKLAFGFALIAHLSAVMLAWRVNNLIYVHMPEVSYARTVAEVAGLLIILSTLYIVRSPQYLRLDQGRDKR